MIIACRPAVKVFNWLLTMYRGRITCHPSMLWTLGFMVNLRDRRHDGRAAGHAAADFLMHNTTFWSRISTTDHPGVLFGYLAGYMYWFPKAFGFKMNEPWARPPSGSG